MPIQIDNESPPLFLGEDAILYVRQLNDQRILHPGTDGELIDSVYIYQIIETPQKEQLESVRLQIIRKLYPLGYTNWQNLNEEERVFLVSQCGGSEEAIEALKSLGDGEQISSLNILTGPQANHVMRREFWEVASQGKLPLSPKSLGWILQRQDWSTNPILPYLARNLIETNSAEASKYMFHDSLKVRLHMSDLIDNTDSLIDWLKLESNPLVRQHIRLNIQKNNSISSLVEQLIKDTTIAQVIGWILANWSQAITQEKDWEALRVASQKSIGLYNQKLIKNMLRQRTYCKL